MNRVGLVREVVHSTLQWCDTAYDEDVVYEGWLVLCFEDEGYCRVFCLDDGRVYHFSRDWFDMMTRELR